MLYKDFKYKCIHSKKIHYIIHEKLSNKFNI